VILFHIFDHSLCFKNICKIGEECNLLLLIEINEQMLPYVFKCNCFEIANLNENAFNTLNDNRKLSMKVYA